MAAAEHERAALRLKPGDALAHANLGNILFEQHQLAAAKNEYEAALKADPEQAQARDGLSAVTDE